MRSWNRHENPKCNQKSGAGKELKGHPGSVMRNESAPSSGGEWVMWEIVIVMYVGTQY